METLMDGYRGENIAFIIGSPRSGTTWLQRLLACHPDVRTGQESHIFAYVGPQIRTWRNHIDTNHGGRGGAGLPSYFQEDEFMALIREYMVKLLQPMVGNLKQGELFVEKTPNHALFVREIAAMLPSSRVIHILRDPRDVTASLLTASKSWGGRWAPSTARSAARVWVRHVCAAREASRWLPREQFLEIRYEDLSRHPTRTLSEISGFLGLAWDQRQLEEALEQNSVENTRRGGGTPIPLGGEFKDASGPVAKTTPEFVRRAQPGAWQRDLSRRDKVQVWMVARNVMAEVGYRWALPL